MTAAGLYGKTVKNVSAVLHKAFSVALKQGLISTIKPFLKLGGSGDLIRA